MNIKNIFYPAALTLALAFSMQAQEGPKQKKATEPKKKKAETSRKDYSAQEIEHMKMSANSYYMDISNTGKAQAKPNEERGKPVQQKK